MHARAARKRPHDSMARCQHVPNCHAVTRCTCQHVISKSSAAVAPAALPCRNNAMCAASSISGSRPTQVCSASDRMTCAATRCRPARTATEAGCAASNATLASHKTVSHKTASHKPWGTEYREGVFKLGHAALALQQLLPPPQDACTSVSIASDEKHTHPCAQLRVRGSDSHPDPWVAPMGKQGRAVLGSTLWIDA